MLLECEPTDSPQQVMARLRQRLEQRRRSALLAADVDSVQDADELRRLLRQAQAALAQAPPSLDSSADPSGFVWPPLPTL